jgi:hypothetical protein
MGPRGGPLLELGIAFAMLVGVAPSSARAERCGPPVPWIEVTLEGDAWLHELGPSLIGDLRASLHLRGIATCTELDPRDGVPGAHVRIAAEGASARIEVWAASEETGFSRALILRGLPGDVRALTLAANVDEALRSNWAHLLRPSVPLDDQGQPIVPEAEARNPAPDPPDPPACEVEPRCDSAPIEGCPVPPPCPPSSPALLAFVAFGGIDAFTTGFVLLGGGAGVRIRPIDRLEIELDAFGSSAIAQSVPPGTVGGESGGGSLSLRLGLMEPSEVIRVYAVARSSCAAVWLHATSHEGASASAVQGVVTAGVGAELAFTLDRTLDGFAELAASGAMAGAYVTDGAQRLTGPAGFAIAARAGLAFWPSF